MTIPRSSDFTFTWTGFATGTLHAAVIGAVNGSMQVNCTFDAAAGTGTFPAQALAMIPTDGPSYINFESIREDEIDAGDFAVTLRASTHAVWPANTLAGGQVTLE